MNKTELGESDIDPESISEVHECSTVAEVIDYLYWVFSEDEEYADEIDLFFRAFRGACEDYDANIPSKDAARLLRRTFDTFESIRSNSSWSQPSIAHTAKHLAQSVDNRFEE